MDLPILKYLDVLVGLAFVMMLGCTVVAAVTQAITSSFYLRAQYLRQGLADLLQQLDPTARAADCQYAAQLIQRHPLVCRPATVFGVLTTMIRRKFFGKQPWLPSGAPAETVQRHEFARILLEWAAGQGVLGNGPANELAGKLRTILMQNGVTSPAGTLAAIEHHTIAQERAHPQQPAHQWHTAALIDACPSTFAGKVTGWYDAMTLRASQRFTLQSKLIGGVVSLLLVALLPLDSLELVRRLSVNDAERKAFVEAAEKWVKETPAPEASASRNAHIEAAKKELSNLSALNVGTQQIPNGYYLEHLPGLLLSWVLLSLGTPFWYDSLKNLLKLRSMLAQKDEKERAERQSASSESSGTQSAGAAAAAGVVAVAAEPDIDDEAGEFAKAVVVG